MSTQKKTVTARSAKAAGASHRLTAAQRLAQAAAQPFNDFYGSLPLLSPYKVESAVPLIAISRNELLSVYTIANNWDWLVAPYRVALSWLERIFNQRGASYARRRFMRLTPTQKALVIRGYALANGELRPVFSGGIYAVPHTIKTQLGTRWEFPVRSKAMDHSVWVA